MDQQLTGIYSTTFVILMVFWTCALLPGVSTSEVPVGEVYHQCRDDNVTFTWDANVTDFYFIDLTFIPHDLQTSNSSNARNIIMSIYPKKPRPTLDYRYHGRLTHTVSDGVYSFKLIGVSTKDRGFYELTIAGKKDFQGKSDLVVYAEDNLWPTEDPEAVQLEMEDTEGKDQSEHIYPFIRPKQSPVIGMKMSVASHEHIHQFCYFHNLSRCEVIFRREELEVLSGTIRFNVEPQLENNSVVCSTVKMPYDYQIKMLHHKLSSALVGGILVSVFIAIAACVIPPVIIYVKKNRDQYIPLKGGPEFIKGCVDRIEVTPDVSDVYRKNATSKMVHPHIQAYFQDPKAREGFFQDEGLTKIYFAAFIKHYITHVREPLIPLDFIQAIKAGEFERDENFNISDVKSEFTIRKKDSKKTKTRKRIVRLLFQHFSWFRDRKISADGSDSAENSPSKILTTAGLCGLLAMNFDRTKAQVDMQEFDKVARLTRFLKNLVIHCDEIFGHREEINGQMPVDTSLNITSEPLLDSEA